MRLLRKKHFFVSSADRTSGLKGDFTVGIESHHLKRQGGEQIKCFISEAVIPYTWANINSSNNQFNYGASAGTPSLTTYTIPEGNYTVYDIRDWITANVSNLTITYTKTSSKFVFTSDLANQRLSFDGLTNSASELLGFLSASDTGSVSTTITSTQATNLIGVKSLFIHSNLTHNNIAIINRGGNNHDDSDILAKIPIVCPPYGNVIYRNSDNDTDILVDRNINSIRFYLTDQHDVLTLQHDWSFTLTFEYWDRETNRLYDVMKEVKELIKLQVLGKALKRDKQKFDKRIKQFEEQEDEANNEPELL